MLGLAFSISIGPFMSKQLEFAEHNGPGHLHAPNGIRVT